MLMLASWHTELCFASQLHSWFMAPNGVTVLSRPTSTSPQGCGCSVSQNCPGVLMKSSLWASFHSHPPVCTVTDSWRHVALPESRRDPSADSQALSWADQPFSLLSLYSPQTSWRMGPLFWRFSLARHSSLLTYFFQAPTFAFWSEVRVEVGVGLHGQDHFPVCSGWLSSQRSVLQYLLIPGREKVADTKQNQPTNQKLFRTLLMSSVCKSSGCPWQSHCQGLGPGT